MAAEKFFAREILHFPFFPRPPMFSFFSTFILPLLSPGSFMDWNLLQTLSIFAVSEQFTRDPESESCVCVRKYIEFSLVHGIHDEASSSLNHTLYDMLHASGEEKGVLDNS